MASFFTTNKIFLDAEAVSGQLKEAREAKKLKISDVSKKLSISHEYLSALENNEFYKLPRGVYGKNFLKEYALFLGLDSREMMEIFEKETAEIKKDKEQHLFSSQVVKNHYFLAIPKILRNTIIAIIIIICFVYLGYGLNKLTAPPLLSISVPPENFITKEKSVDVSGTTEAETQITVNGEQVLPDAHGVFSKKVDLKNGINTITITVKKKYGRANTIERQVLVKDDNLQL